MKKIKKIKKLYSLIINEKNLKKLNYYDYTVIKNDVTNYSNSRRIIRQGI